MKSVPRRTSLRQTGRAAAIASVGRGVAASARIAIVADPADTLISSPTVQWAQTNCAVRSSKRA